MEEWLGPVRAFSENQIRLATDFPFYAESKQFLRTKSGSLQPFKLNAAQMAFWRQMEAQRERIGKVRQIVIKSRQQGFSSFCSGWTTWSVLTNLGTSALIVGHRDTSATHIYGMAQTFIANLPPEERPALEVQNATDLRLKSGGGFSVAVAAADGSGTRGQTAQYIHVTEAGFIPKLTENLSAIMQVLPNLPGTGAVIETTPDSMGSELHNLVLRALSGAAGDWQIFHAPWYLTEEYRLPVPADFQVTTDEKELMALYGVDEQQLSWRRWKLAETGDPKKFQREFSANLHEAFTATETDAFIDAADVLHAMKSSSDVEPHGEMVLGVDVARFGSDSTAIAFRRGRVIEKIEMRRGLSTMETAGWVESLIRETNCARCAIDVGGVGAGVVDRLLERNRGDIVVAVNFGSKPEVPAPLGEDGKPAGGPANRRAELWMNIRKALETRRFKIPDDQALMAELLAPTYRYDSSGRVLLESKQDMRKRGVPSPDRADACALTLYEPLGVPITKSRATNFNRKIEYPKIGIA